MLSCKWLERRNEGIETSDAIGRGALGYMVRGDRGGTGCIWNDERKDYDKNGTNGIFAPTSIPQPQNVAEGSNSSLYLFELKRLLGQAMAGLAKSSPVFGWITGVCELTVTRYR